ncbi:MAG: hypothetical protein AAFP19_25175, partial [Bacteroidota bacterium]
MQVQKIQEYLKKYQNKLQRSRELQGGFRWESLQIFQQAWEVEAPNLAEMYDRSLQNTRSRRLWKGENYYPKEMMIKFMELEPDFCRRMFRFLFIKKKSKHSTTKV